MKKKTILLVPNNHQQINKYNHTGVRSSIQNYKRTLSNATIEYVRKASSQIKNYKFTNRLNNTKMPKYLRMYVRSYILMYIFFLK